MFVLGEYPSSLPPFALYNPYNGGTNLWYSPKGSHIFHLMLGVPSKVWWFKVTHRPKRPIVQYGIWCEFRGEMPELLQYPYISLKSFLNIFYFCCFAYVLSEICSEVIDYPHISSNQPGWKFRFFFCFLTKSYGRPKDTLPIIKPSSLLPKDCDRPKLEVVEISLIFFCRNPTWRIIPGIVSG